MLNFADSDLVGKYYRIICKYLIIVIRQYCYFRKKILIDENDFQNDFNFFFL